MSGKPVASSIVEPLFRRAEHVAELIGRSPFAPNSWVARIGSFTSIVLLAVALMALQLSFLGKALLFHLPSYAVISIAVVIGCIALSRKSAPDRACLCGAVIFGGYVCARALTSPAPYFARADLYCTLAALGAYLLVSIGLVSSSRRVALLVLLWAFAAYQVFIGFVQFGVGQNL